MKVFKKKSTGSGGETRVAAGFLRGRKLTTPGAGTHPMGSREKLALFNMISAETMRAEILDAYAGSGALGIEAMSRGARHVIFIEKAPRAVEVIRENLGRLELLEDAEIFQGSVGSFQSERRFDVVIADPPYDDFKIDEVVYLTSFVKTGGVFVLSHPGEAPELPGLELQKSNAYAASHISVYVK